MQTTDFPIKDIQVKDRQRTTFPDDSGLKESISKHGLIHPITITRAGKLIAGERRLRACSALGFDSIPVVFKDEITAEQESELELEENLHRENLTDEEKIDAILRLHKLKQQLYGAEWGLADTADSVGISRSLAGLYIQVAKAKARSSTVAEVLKKDGVTAAYKQANFETSSAVTAIITSKRVAALPRTVGSFDPSVYYKLGDSLNLIKDVRDETIDLLFTDPPYGLDVGDMNMFGSLTTDIQYEDSWAHVLPLLRWLATESMRVLKPDSFFLVWVGYPKIGEVQEIFKMAGFNVANQPFIWCKDGQPYTPYPDQGFGYACEYAVYGWKGKPHLAVKGARNYIISKPVPIIEKLHPHEKPVDLQLMLMQRFVREGSNILDPFAGTGNVVRAALKGKLNPLAFEKEEGYFNKGTLRLIGENNK